MRKFKLVLLALVSALFMPAKADEGMWLLQMMQEQNLADRMKERGLKLDIQDIYNPNKVTLKDAVGIFGGGCTGEIISPNGLILTNHHCGYASIQRHSSVEHDYLTDGFWAKSMSEELPTPGLTFKFIERIVDITELVNNDIRKNKVAEEKTFTAEYLDKLAQSQLKKSDLYKSPGISAMALPFYAGNRYYLFFIRTYRDVRMVAAPPSSIGKFGGETDNWMWPRHTGDFSMFRIYTDKNGNPAEYSPENIPLKAKKFLSISLRGYQEGDYAMIMGFPGSTSRYLTASEVRLRMDAINTPRVDVRTIRLDILRGFMNKNDKIRIQYANKFAGSSNYWKNSIGMNKAIVSNHVLEAKAEQEARFLKFAQEKANKDYESVVKQIDAYVTRVMPLRKTMTYFSETFSAIEYRASASVFDKLIDALRKNKKADINKAIDNLKQTYKRIHDKDYDHEVDRKVAEAVLPFLAQKVDTAYLPDFYQTVKGHFNGDFTSYIAELYDNTILANQKNFDKFIAAPSIEAIQSDLAYQMAKGVAASNDKLSNEINKASEGINLLHKTYVRGLVEMISPTPTAPDANFTLRMTYGNVKAYNPKDGIHYNYYTTLKGVMEKEDPNNPEFIVPAKLKALYEAKDYGRYALPNGEMPTCFLTNNDITGGNSGSPVMNGNGELIGSAFDGNWESLSGDINFDNNMQRTIVVDIRYVLFIVEKLGGCTNLIDEMHIVE